MILLGSIAVDLSREIMHPFIKFVPILDILIAQDVEEVHELDKFIPFDDTFPDDGHFLHSYMDEHVSFTEDAHGEVTVHRNDFSDDGPDTAVLTTESDYMTAGDGVDLGEDVVELIRIRDRGDLTHELGVEADGPDCLREELE